MSSAKSVTAVFGEDQTVAVTVSGGNGDVTDGAEGLLDCDETNPAGTCTETYDYGDDITLTASADAGYRFTGWSGTDAASCSGSTCTFSDIAAAKAVTATFVAEWDVVVTVAGTGEGGVTDGAEGLLDCDETNDPCTESYDAGTNITLTATAATGSTFTGWSGADAASCSSNTCTFSTIALAKAVTATFDIETFNVAVTVSGGNGDVTDGAEGALACDETNPAGTCTETYDYGDDITLTASADAGYRFTGWSGTDAASCSGSTCTFSDIAAAKAVTATFVAEWDVVVTVAGTGEGGVTDGAEGLLDCDETNDPCTESYDAGTNITLTATAATGSTFTGWSGADAASCSSNTCTFSTIALAKAVTATFDIETFNVAVTVSGGNGDVTDGAEGALACDETNPAGTCTETYDYGDDITLTASADAGYRFTGWSGTDAASCSGSTCTFSDIAAAKAVTATFVAEWDVVVTVAGTGEGGVTDGAEGLLDCDETNDPCTESYDAGTNITLTATAATGSTFTGWSGADAASCSSNTCTFSTIALAKAVTATFDIETFNVAVTVSGGNGDVTDGAEGALACDETNPAGTCTETYDYGDDITLTASADAGYRFTGWSGTDAASCSGSTCTFSDIAAAKAVTATFVAEWDVVVTVAGTGEGGVTDGAEGLLDCDETNDPCTESYDAGTNITLTATAATGSTFTGWSGADAASCSSNTCTFSTIAAAKAVTATFTDLIALYITYSGDGSGSVSDSAETYSDGEVTYWVAGSSVTLSQVSSDDFLGWRVAISGIPNPALCAIATSNCTLTMNQDTLVDAEFDAASSGGGGGGGGGSSSPAPINTVSPELSGFTSPGASIVATSGTWEGASSYSFQWYRCTAASAVTQVSVPAGCVAITGADSATYLIQATDNGYWLRVRVRATGSGGATSIVSATSAKVGAKPASVKAKPPRVMNGLVNVGSTLAAKRGQWTNGPVTYAYQWYRCTKAGVKNPRGIPAACTAITGATSKTYTVKAADRGSFLRVRVTATGATGQGFRMSRTTGIIPN